MFDFRSMGQVSKETAVMLAGFVAAMSCFALLPADRLEPVTAATTSENLEVAKALSDAKRLGAKGRWQAAGELLKEFSTSTNPEILLEEAKLLAAGKGVPRNLDAARLKLLQAVQQEFPKRGEAAFELAKVYRRSSGEDCARIAFEWFSKAALWGVKKAHVEMGKHFSRGIGVAIDMERALHHYRIAAKLDSARSLLTFIELLAKKPELNDGLPDMDALVSSALVHLKNEALAGRGSSAKALGRLYRDGKLISRDLAKAHYWLARGSQLGDSGAMTDLALMMLAGEFSTASPDAALTLLQQASSLQNSGAHTELGRLHLAGSFGLKRAMALEYFREGVKAAHAGSMLEMAILYFEGDLVAKDKKQAVKLLKRAASLNHTGSKRLLAAYNRADVRGWKLYSVAPAVSKEVGFLTEKTSVEKLFIKPGIEKSVSPNGRSNTGLVGKQRPLTGATIITRFGKQG